VDQSLLIITVGRNPLDEDRTVAETSTLQHTTPGRDKFSCRGRNSNPQSQEVSGRTPSPQTARSLESEIIKVTNLKRP